MIAVTRRDALYFRLYVEHCKVLGSHHSCLYHKKQKMNKLEINDYFALIKKEIVNEISPEKDEFRDTYQIHQLIAKTGRAEKKIRTLKLGIFIHFRGCSGQKKNR